MLDKIICVRIIENKTTCLHPFSFYFYRLSLMPCWTYILPLRRYISLFISLTQRIFCDVFTQKHLPALSLTIAVYLSRNLWILSSRKLDVINNSLAKWRGPLSLSIRSPSFVSEFVCQCPSSFRKGHFSDLRYNVFCFIIQKQIILIK